MLRAPILLLINARLLLEASVFLKKRLLAREEQYRLLVIAGSDAVRHQNWSGKPTTLFGLGKERQHHRALNGTVRGYSIKLLKERRVTRLQTREAGSLFKQISYCRGQETCFEQDFI